MSEEHHKKHGWHKAVISLPIASIIIVTAFAGAGGAMWGVTSGLNNNGSSVASYTLGKMESEAAMATCVVAAGFSPSSVQQNSPSTLTWQPAGAVSLRRECTNTCGGHQGVYPNDPLVWLSPTAGGSAPSPLGTNCVGRETCIFYCGDPAGNVGGFAKSLTVTAPSITVTYPNGGESLRVGNTYIIKWTSAGIPSNATIYIGIDFTMGGITRYAPIVLTGIPNSPQTYSWTVPSVLNDGAGHSQASTIGPHKIVVSRLPSPVDRSNASFTIVP
ncbi:MAG: hypothetical protein Q7S28_03730 [bacterium]|nr:hypothetical protein [bacterium]